jgi:hypothetical protein
MRFRTIVTKVGVPAAIAAGLLGGLATAASASTGPVAGTTAPNGNANIVQMTGKNAAVYTDPVFGPVSCTEVHHNAVKTGADNAADFDSITCKSTTGLPLTGVTAGQAGYTVGWNSDFPAGRTFDLATGSITLNVSADGLSYTGIATYPAG